MTLEREQKPDSQPALLRMVNNLPGMAFRCRNNRTWTMEFVSEGCLELTGYSAADLILDKQVAYGQLIHPADRDMVWQEVQAALRDNRRYQLIYRLITAAGEEKWVWEQGSAVSTGAEAEPQIEGFITDVTGKHLAEESLKQQKEILQKIFDHVPIMINFYDADGRCLLVNREWERVFGWSQQEALETDILAESYPDPADWQEVLDYIRMAPPGWRDFKELVRSGQVIDTAWTNIRLSDGSIIGIGQDITERKRAEEALRASEERFSLAVQGANDGLWDWDIANGTLYWSPRLKELLGYAAAELETDFETFEAMLHPDDRAPTMAAIEAHLNQREPYNVEHRLRTKSGEYRWHLSRGQAIWNETGQPVRMVGFTSDITARKRAEEELEQRAAQLKLINEIGSQIVRAYEVDRVLSRTARLIQATFDYHHVALFLIDGDLLSLKAVAGSYEPYFPGGHTQPLTAGINGWVATHGEKVVANDVSAEPRYISLIAQHTITRAELCLPIKIAGQTIGVLDIQSPRPNVFGQNDVLALETLTHQIAVAIENARLYEAVQQELAERRRVETALRDEKMLVDALMDSVPDSIYFKDRRSRLTRVNRKLMQDLGLTDMSEVIGKTDVELFGEEFGRQTLADEQRLLNSGEAIVGLLESRTLANGQINWTLTNKVPLRDANGQIIGLAGVTRDINDLKKTEEALKKYSEQLEEIVKERTAELEAAQERLLRREKLAALGQMAGGIAHELRNPLNNIKNIGYYLNMVLKESQAEVKDTLAILDKEIDAAERIVSGLLNFARTKAPNRREVDINSLVQSIVEKTVLPTEAGSIELVTDLADELPPVVADPDQLSQVFDNLIGNAVQAMTGPAGGPAGGQLRIKTELAGPNHVCVSFSDTGVGIPPENLAKIFEPLFTTKARGIGLGLALAQTLVEANGGWIEVKSVINEGSTFWVSLPVSDSPDSL